jgi:hypothetical protein
MANTVIQLKYSAIPGNIPGGLANGEIALNYADGKFYYKNLTGQIVSFSGSSGSGSGNVYSFATINANNSLITALSNNSVLTINPGDNIGITPDIINDIITISANLKPAFDKANAANVLAYNTGIGANNYAGVMANAANSYAASLTTPNLTPIFNRANSAYALANDVYNVSTVVSNTAPSNPVQGKLWWNSILGTTFIYYVDPDGTASWVEAVPNGGGSGGGGGSTDYSPAFNQANAAFNAANSSANNLANTSIAANNYAGFMANSANAYAASLTPDLSPAFNRANAAFNAANSSANNLANTSIAANNYAGFMANSANAYAASLTPDLSPAFNKANAAYTVANSAYNNANATLIIAQAAFDRANLSNDILFIGSSYNTANAAYDKANLANVLAYNTGIGANTYASSVGVSANVYSDSLLVTARGYTNTSTTAANNYAGVMANSVNVYTSATYSTLVQFASVFGVINAAFTVANAAYGQANTNLSNGTVTLAGALTTTGQVFANSQITIYPSSGAGLEGGEIQLWGAGSYPDWSIDSYGDQLRFFNGNSGTQQVNFFNAFGGSIRLGINTASPSYAVDVTGDINVTGAFRINGTQLSTGTVDLTPANNWANTVGVYANNYAGAVSNSKVASVTGTPGQIFSSGGTAPTLNLINSGVTATTYGGPSNIPVIVVDAFGRITSASNVAISGGGGGDPTSAYDTANAAFGVANGAFARANLSATAASPTFTGTVTTNANVSNQTLTDGVTINWDVSLGAVATVTLGGDRTIAAPTNLKVGTYLLHVIQDATGSRTLTWNAVFKWPAAVAPTLTTIGSRRDIISFVCDGTNLYGSFLPDVR